MNIKKTIFILGLITLSDVGFSQEADPGQLSLDIPENILSISPQVSSFYKVNFFNTNYYSGKPNIDIPLFSIKLGNLNIPLSLTYNTLGVKVDDKGGAVGINWSLNCGGSIIRNIQDLPDNEVGYTTGYEEDAYSGEFQLRAALSGVGINRKSAKSHNSRLDWGPIIDLRFALYTEDTTNELPRNDFDDLGYTELLHYDVYPDIFNIAAPGLNTSFLAMNTTSKDIYPNNNNGFSIRFLDNGGHKMSSLDVGLLDLKGHGFYDEYQFDKAFPLAAFPKHYDRADMPIKDFKQFKILSNDGYEYTFDQMEVQESFYFPMLTGDLPTNPLYSSNRELSTMVSNNYNRRISNWNLSKIVDTRTSDKVEYIYEAYTNSLAEKSTSVNKPAYVNPSPVENCNYEIQSYRKDHLTFSDSFETSIKRLLSKRLTKIIYKAGEIEFFYNDREDYLGEKRLESIKVTEGTSVEYYDLTYDYVTSFEGDSGTDYKRLFLKKITKRFGESQEITGKEDVCKFTYYSPTRLPRKGSLQQDYLGFFNANGITDFQTADKVHMPQLYFYQLNKEESLLPFKRKDVIGLTIGGSMSLEPNINSTVGLLDSVIYPTGGGVKLSYENHTFLYKGIEYLAPGARVSRQNIFDKDIIRTIQYSYVGDDGKSSGSFNNIPVFGFLKSAKGTATTVQPSVFTIYDKSRVNLELSAGAYIGYARVKEEEVGNGYKVYQYTSPKDNPNLKEVRTGVTPCEILLINNSAFPSSTFVDNSYKQGQLLNLKIFDKDNKSIHEEYNGYDDKIIEKLDFSGEHRISNQERIRNAIIHKIKVSSPIYIKNYLNTTKKEKSLVNAIELVKNKELKYNAFGMLNQIITDESSGKKSSIKIDRISDLASTLPSSYNTLSTSNRLLEPLKQETFINTTSIEKKEMAYDFNGNFFLPRSINVTLKGQTYKDVEILSRSKTSKITSVKDKDGVRSYLWGYYDQYPIAEIKNATYAEIVAILTQNLIDDLNLPIISDNTIQASMARLRAALPNALITSYTYKPLVGMTSKTDPRGVTEYYKYDGMQRLQAILDHLNYVNKSFDYHYRSN